MHKNDEREKGGQPRQPPEVSPEQLPSTKRVFTETVMDSAKLMERLLAKNRGNRVATLSEFICMEADARDKTSKPEDSYAWEQALLHLNPLIKELAFGDPGYVENGRDLVALDDLVKTADEVDMEDSPPIYIRPHVQALAGTYKEARSTLFPDKNIKTIESSVMKADKVIKRLLEKNEGDGVRTLWEFIHREVDMLINSSRDDNERFAWEDTFKLLKPALTMNNNHLQDGVDLNKIDANSKTANGIAMEDGSTIKPYFETLATTYREARNILLS